MGICRVGMTRGWCRVPMVDRAGRPMLRTECSRYAEVARYTRFSTVPFSLGDCLIAAGLNCTSLHIFSELFQSQQTACSALRHLDMFSRAMLRSLMPVEEVPTDGTYEEPYPLLKLKAPVVTGAFACG